MDMIFSCKDDMVVGMNLIAVSALAFPKIKVFTFETWQRIAPTIRAGRFQPRQRLKASFPFLPSLPLFSLL